MNRLTKLLKGKLMVVGLHPSEKVAQVKAFAKLSGVKFPVLSDSSTLLSLIGSANGTNVLSTAIVLPNGLLIAKANGYSRKSLREMLTKIEKATGKKVMLELTGFPRELFYGQTMSFGLIPP